MIKQIAMRRASIAKVKEAMSSDESDNDENENSSIESSNDAQKIGCEVNAKYMTDNGADTNAAARSLQLASPHKRQSIVGGRVTEVDELPWKSCGDAVGSCNMRDVDMIFISNCVTGPKQEINNKRSLLRFQFLDCIVAIACIKYLNSGICTSISVAIDMFMGNNICKYAVTRDDERFIKIVLPSRPVDEILKFYLRNLKECFNKISFPCDFSPTMRTLNLNRWVRLCELCQFNLGERTYKQCFIFSKMQGTADIFSSSYHAKEIQFIEFIEAVARLAYKRRVAAVEKGMRKADGELSDFELNMHVTIQTLCQSLRETIKEIIKFAVKVQDF